jgi:hypothetical protein
MLFTHRKSPLPWIAEVIALIGRKALLAIGLTLIVCGIAVAASAQLATAPGGGEVISPESSSSRSDINADKPLPDSESSGSSAALAVSTEPKPATGIDWFHLVGSSLAFLTVEHSYRYATEATTRRAFHKPFFESYANSVANLHGWADGDPFIVNYVGHPMQGAVSGFMWQHDDLAYRTVEFGRNRRYWKEKLRGMAFAYVYSVQFEIGPISEASIGNVQSMYPQVGFVDHVITPTIGMGWAVTEDAIDRMLIQRLEEKVSNPYFRIVARGTLNPSRSFANVMGGNLPWHRDDRPGVFKPFPESAAWAAATARRTESRPVDPPPGVAPFDFRFNAYFTDYLSNGGAGPCMGGGGTAAFRLAAEWQMLVDVGGCKMLGFKENWSGTTLTYMVGPRWTPQVSGHWVPHAQALVGGAKFSQEYQNPVLKAEVADWHPINDEGRTAKHAFYSTDWDDAVFAMKAGAGVDYKFNNALALQLANLEYSHAWINDLSGINYRNAVQVSGGLVLRMGTW